MDESTVLVHGDSTLTNELDATHDGCEQGEFQAFAKWAESRRRLAKRTIRTYLVWIKDADREFHRRGSCLSAADGANLVGYLELIPQTVASRNSASAALKVWFEYLGKVGRRLDSPTDKLVFLPPPKRQPQPIDRDRISPFLDECFKSSTMLGTMAVLYLNTGLRLDELRLRRWASLSGRRLFLTQKGGGERVVILSAEARETLDRWAEIRACHTWIFPSSIKDGPVSANWVYMRIRAAGSAAGIENMHPHRLRHTSITEYYRNSKDPLSTQRFAGHSDFTTTRLYVELVDIESDPFVEGFGFRNLRDLRTDLLTGANSDGRTP